MTVDRKRVIDSELERGRVRECERYSLPPTYLCATVKASEAEK